MKYQCALCGADYHVDHVRQWGKHKESDGNGNKAVCTALVPDHLGSGQVCKGDLVALPTLDGEVEKLAAKITPITTR